MVGNGERAVPVAGACLKLHRLAVTASGPCERLLASAPGISCCLLMQAIYSAIGTCVTSACECHVLQRVHVCAGD